MNESSLMRGIDRARSPSLARVVTTPPTSECPGGAGVAGGAGLGSEGSDGEGDGAVGAGVATGALVGSGAELGGVAPPEEQATSRTMANIARTGNR
jgi:hypothetical protein